MVLIALVLIVLVVVIVFTSGYRRLHRHVNDSPPDLRRADDEKPRQIKNIGGTRGLNF